jgi:hypothetical protein
MNINLKIKVPIWVKEEIGEKEIIRRIANETLLNMEYYRSRMLPYEVKYKMKFPKFEKKVLSKKKEKFKEWDDLIIWEGLYKAYREWEQKYKELAKCIKS